MSIFVCFTVLNIKIVELHAAAPLKMLFLSGCNYQRKEKKTGLSKNVHILSAHFHKLPSSS